MLLNPSAISKILRIRKDSQNLCAFRNSSWHDIDHLCGWNSGIQIRKFPLRLPRGSVVENHLLTFDPWSGKILMGRTTKPLHIHWDCPLGSRSHNYCAYATPTVACTPQSPRSAIWEATAKRRLNIATKSSPCLQQLKEKACAAMKTQHSQK